MRQQKVEEQPGKAATKSYSKEGYLFLMEKSKYFYIYWKMGHIKIRSTLKQSQYLHLIYHHNETD